MNKDIEKNLDEIIDFIKSQEEYKRCISLKKKMKENNELTSLIEDIKSKQKEYIRSNRDLNKEKELEELNKKLEEFPIYLEYNNNLKIINEEIELLKERLNNYFTSIINIDL